MREEFIALYKIERMIEAFHYRGQCLLNEMQILFDGEKKEMDAMWKQKSKVFLSAEQIITQATFAGMIEERRIKEGIDGFMNNKKLIKLLHDQALSNKS